MTDPAAEFHAMYLAFCADCRRAGLPVPTADEWLDALDDHIQQRAQPGGDVDLA